MGTKYNVLLQRCSSEITVGKTGVWSCARRVIDRNLIRWGVWITTVYEFLTSESHTVNHNVCIGPDAANDQSGTSWQLKRRAWSSFKECVKSKIRVAALQAVCARCPQKHLETRNFQSLKFRPTSRVLTSKQLIQTGRWKPGREGERLIRG